MIIRKATINDSDFLKQIKPNLDLDIITSRLLRQQKNEVEFLILLEDEKPISFVLLKWKGKETHPDYPDIEDLYTKEDERGKGYGSLLIAECERRSKLNGYSKIGLAVNTTENNKVKVLYEKLGYKPTGGKAYIDGVYNGVEDWCIDMEKDLLITTI